MATTVEEKQSQLLRFGVARMSYVPTSTKNEAWPKKT